MWIKYFVVFFFYIRIFADNIDFSRIHDLDSENRTYSYPINFSLGGLINNLPIFTTSAEDPESGGMILRDVCALGGEVKISWFITNMFCAKTFGFFPKTGILFQGFSMNYARELLSSCGIFFDSLFRGSLKWEYMPKEINFNINILWVNEPETNIFQKNRIVPQIGVGLSILKLHHDLNLGSKKLINPSLLDLCFLQKILFIKKTSCCDIEFSFGYTYNPLLGVVFGGDNAKKNLIGGIINFFGGVAFSFYFDLGLESIDWFDEDFKKLKYYKKTFFVDVSPGVGKWYDNLDGNKAENPTSAIYPQILMSFTWPYMSKICDSFFYGFGFDLSEDIRKSVDKNASFGTLALNNFNLVFNFAQFTWGYKTIRLSYNFGIYILTNLYNTFNSLDNMVYFGQREIAEKPSGVDNNIVKWFDYLTGRVTYRPRVYINIFKMIPKRKKFKFLDKFVLVIGINRILFNHRNDWLSKKNKNGEYSFNIEFSKIEGVFIGVSIEM